MPLTGEAKRRYMRRYREDRRSLRVELAFRHLGRTCRLCGREDLPDSELEFHHVDPDRKDFEVRGGGWSYSLPRFLEEVHKCVVLCTPCHVETDPHRFALAREIGR